VWISLSDKSVAFKSFRWTLWNIDVSTPFTFQDTSTLFDIEFSLKSFRKNKCSLMKHFKTQDWASFVFDLANSGNYVGTKLIIWLIELKFKLV
jgi:hypothetical protein